MIFYHSCKSLVLIAWCLSLTCLTKVVLFPIPNFLYRTKLSKIFFINIISFRFTQGMACSIDESRSPSFLREGVGDVTVSLCRGSK